MGRANPHFKVEIIGGTGDIILWDSWIHKRLFLSLRINLTTDQSSMFEVQFRDPDFNILNRYSRADGISPLVMRAWAGYGENLGEPWFKGKLAGVDYGNDATTLRAYDMAYGMKLDEKMETHKGTDLQIIKKLIERNKLQFVTAPEVKGLKPKSAKQTDDSDWEYLLKLTGDMGLVVYTRGDTVFCMPPAKVGTPIISLRRNDSTILDEGDFRYKLPENKLSKDRKIKTHYTKKGDKHAVVESDDSGRGRTRHHRRRSIRRDNTPEAQRRAQAIKDLGREKSFDCTIKSFLPMHERADVRDTAEVLDRGYLFSGLYLIDEVTIDFQPGDLSIEYTLHRDVKPTGIPVTPTGVVQIK